MRIATADWAGIEQNWRSASKTATDKRKGRSRRLSRAWKFMQQFGHATEDGAGLFVPEMLKRPSTEGPLTGEPAC
jgi:hypothetical protein